MIKKAIMGALLSASVFSFTPITVNANVNMGDFKVTYYWPGEDNWGHRTATGVRSSNLYTVAVDPNAVSYTHLLMAKRLLHYTRS